MIETRIALLRGVNVGTAKRLRMADLRALLERLGFLDVRTLLNSGNVVFTLPKGSRGDAAVAIEKAIASQLGVSTRVTVLTGKEVAAAVRSGGIGKMAADPSRHLVLVLRTPNVKPRLKPLLERRWVPEALSLGTRVAYLWCPNGIIDSPLWAAVSRVVGEDGTARNMATMRKLLALVEGGNAVNEPKSPDRPKRAG